MSLFLAAEWHILLKQSFRLTLALAIGTRRNRVAGGFHPGYPDQARTVKDYSSSEPGPHSGGFGRVFNTEE